jgi:hypothetical protein
VSGQELECLWGKADCNRLVTVVRRVDCTHGPQAVVAVTRLAERLGIPIEVREIIIQTDEEARLSHRLDSPTVLVAGRDVEPGVRERATFGVT